MEDFTINYSLPWSRGEIFEPRIKLEAWNTTCFKNVVYTKEIVQNIDESKLFAEDNIISNVKQVEKKDLTEKEFYDFFVNRTREECLLESRAPQRSKVWHDARRYCITASNFGAVVGHNPYCSPEATLIEKLWASFVGSENTAYGTFHEPDAQKSFLKALEETSWLEDLYGPYESYKFIEVGLLKHFEQPWMAVSPDGLLSIKGPKGPKLYVIEFKCPSSQRDSEMHPYRKSPKNVPVYYMDQIQGIMGLLNKFPDVLDQFVGPYSGSIEALFIVWQPKQMHVTRVPFDLNYYRDYLEPNLLAWHKKFVYFSTLKAKNELVKNSLEKILKI